MRVNAMEYVIKFLRVLRLTDFFDIAIVAVITYCCIMALKGTRAVQQLRGLLVVAAIYFLSNILHLNSLNYILNGMVQFAVVALIVIFQPELRKLLEHMGRFKVLSFLGIDIGSNDTADVIDNVAGAAVNLSKTRTGALIVIERETRLGEYMNSGVALNAAVSSELLEQIFVPNTPLHDGAVIIRENQIITAGCVLPLTANTNLSSELGTRHRAALGLSESSDAIIVVVSEETGKISIAQNGSLTRNLDEILLRKLLGRLMEKDSVQNKESLKKVKFWKSK